MRNTPNRDWLGWSGKVEKSLDLMVYSPIMYLDPSVKGICPYQGECIKSCLGPHSGRGVMANVRKARRVKTMAYLASPTAAMEDIIVDVRRHQRKAAKYGWMFAPRLNGTSDITFDIVMEALPNTQFYDYTKNVTAYRKWLRGSYPHRNHHLTLSYDPTSVPMDVCMDVLAEGGSVALAFAGPLPDTYNGYRVINGDATDARFLDRKIHNIPDGIGFIVGLSIKGTKSAKSRAQSTGFAV